MNNQYRSGLAIALFGCVGVLAVASTIIIQDWERPPIDTVQRGYRGTGMVEVYNPRFVAAQQANNVVPEAIPAADPTGTLASEVYENVQVLGHLDDAEFTRLMVAITEWVSPEEGCNYCHSEDGNFASDDKYTKVVSRRMLQMTQHINSSWDAHVGQTGVTCYTCHRGNPVPAAIWFANPGQPGVRGNMLGNSAGQNQPSVVAGYSSLPVDPFSPFLLEENLIRVNGPTALPTGNRQSIKQTEWTYSLMFHLSDSLGVNCTYCHNSRAFSSWETSNPARHTAWYGLRMVPELNRNYLEPLGPVYPAHRLGALGDAPKVNCATCHQGANKPLYGASMLADYPALAAPGPAAP